MSRESAADDLLEGIIDEYSCAILAATSADPFVINENLERLNMSRATAYRHIKKLRGCDLLDEQTRVDESGTQYHVYEANFQTVKLEIVNGIAYLHIVRQDDNEFTRLCDYR